MYYKDYIKLGFERHDMNDSVELDQTGYPGFCLGRAVNERIHIWVNFGDLDKPKMYIKKFGKDINHIFPITTDMVRDIFTNTK